MLKYCTTIIISFFLSSGIAWANDHHVLEGEWNTQGWDPGNSVEQQEDAYTGTASLKVQGESLVFSGDIDDLQYRGVGIWRSDSGTLALHFEEIDTGRVGIAHFELSENRLHGTWAFMDSPEEHGTEIWHRE